MTTVEDAGYKKLVAKLDEFELHIDQVLSFKQKRNQATQPQDASGRDGMVEADGLLARILARLRSLNA